MYPLGVNIRVIATIKKIITVAKMFWDWGTKLMKHAIIENCK